MADTLESVWNFENKINLQAEIKLRDVKAKSIYI